MDLLARTSHLGKPREKSSRSVKFVKVCDLPKVVVASFSASSFTAAGKVYSQHRGTCIGNQISPVLSALPVILCEQAWQSAHKHMLSNYFLFLRYVDNRLILADEAELQSKAMRELCASDFYEDPVQLEAVTDHSWLGFTIDARQRTCFFKIPTQPWQIRAPNSAGSWRLRASGYHSRKALIMQNAWPVSIRKVQVQQLRECYLQAGFPQEVL